MERISAADFQKRYGHNHQARAPRAPHPKPAKQARALGQDHARQALSTGRPVVCFTLCRVNLLDSDAKWGSVKDLLDGLAYAGLIPGDREDQICLDVVQQKVDHYDQEETIIEITYP